MDGQKLLLSVCDFAVTDEYIYFASRNLTGFFRYHIHSKLVEPVCAMEKMELNKSGFGTVCKFGEKLIFAPYYKQELRIYDLQESQLIEEIDLSSLLGKAGKTFRYYMCNIIHQNSIYFLGDSDSEIICLNMDTMHISIVETWKKAGSEYIGNDQFIGISTYKDVCVVKESVWVPLRFYNCILEMDLNTTQAKVHKVDTEQMIFTTICFDGVHFWLTGGKKAIIKWNPHTNTADRFDQFPDGFLTVPKKNPYWNGLFSSSFYENNYVFFFPMIANMAIRIDISTNKAEKFYQDQRMLSCYMVKKWKDHVFYVEWGSGAADLDASMLIDSDGNVLDTDIFSVGWEKINLQNFDRDDEPYIESGLISTGFFLEKIRRTDQKTTGTYKECGTSIYETI